MMSPLKIRLIRVGALAGMTVPIFFPIMVSVLSILEFDFMRLLGWHPIDAPTFDWPSGLALGPYGGWMTTTFILCGLFISLFCIGLSSGLAGNKPVMPDQIFPAHRDSGHKFFGKSSPKAIGTTLLAFSGLAILGLAFHADPTLRSTPATWHGRLHDISYILLGITLFPAMPLVELAFSRSDFGRDRRGRRQLRIHTWFTVVLALPAYMMKGVFFYGFLVAIMVWVEIFAWQLYHLGAEQVREKLSQSREL